ncbi:MAG: cell envelope integrity protein CreD, partial [Tannerella sp.]|nr:cell envelope integrity protein CreD [Tannerella sp.]
IILLTFVVSFFVEISQKKSIHPFQYLLIGAALCLFYSLLISISEHTDFTLAYLIASVMTVAMITLYMIGVLKIRKTALTIGGLLALLYLYIFVLIQMETYALLAGSIGLFVILAVIMYFSQRIKWNRQAKND